MSSILNFKDFKFKEKKGLKKVFIALSFIFLCLVLSPNLSVYAAGGAWGGGDEDITTSDQFDNSVIRQRFNEYVHWYSHGNHNKEKYGDYSLLDENAILGLGDYVEVIDVDGEEKACLAALDGLGKLGGDGRLYGYGANRKVAYDKNIHFYYGRIDYLVKVSTKNEDLESGSTYQRRQYFKYIETSKFHNYNNDYFNESDVINERLGLWLYYMSNETKDKQKEDVGIDLIDIFQGLPCDIDNQYVETLFYWPVASTNNDAPPGSNAAVIGGRDTYTLNEDKKRYDIRYRNVIANHMPFSYDKISKEYNFDLAYIIGQNLRTSKGMNGNAYHTYNTHLTNDKGGKGTYLLLEIPTPSQIENNLKTYVGGTFFSANKFKYEKHIKDGESEPYLNVAMKHLQYVNGKLVRGATYDKKLANLSLNLEKTNAKTYKTPSGTQYSPFFLTKKVDGEYIGFVPMYYFTAAPEEIGGVVWTSGAPGGWNQDQDHSIYEYLWYGMDPTTNNFRALTRNSHGVGDTLFYDATIYGTKLDETPREMLVTVQNLIKSQKDGLKTLLFFTRKSGKGSYINGYGLCTKEIIDELWTLSEDGKDAKKRIHTSQKVYDRWNEYASSNPQLCLDILTVLLHGSIDWIKYNDISSSSMTTSVTIRKTKDNGSISFGNFYINAITYGDVKPMDTFKINLSEDCSELLVVNLFDCFSISKTNQVKIVEAFKENGDLKSLNIEDLNLNIVHVNMIESILKNDSSDSTKIVLTNEQIERGLVDTSDPTSEVYCEYIPYVAVYTKKYKSNLENFKIQNSNLKIEPYNGSNMGTIVDKFVELAKKEPMNFKVLSSTSGVSLFEEGWGERGCGGVPVKRLN